jgi:hypothetical protein
MENREDPNLSLHNLEDDPIVPGSELPIASEGTTEWRAEARRLRTEPRLDQSGDAPTGLGGNLREVVGAHCGVIAKRI